MAIKGVDFGRLEAEADPNLFRYFIDTGVFEKLVSGAKYFVIGRKGSGKTALFRHATTTAMGRPAVHLDFGSDYSWESHKQIVESGLPAESAHVASWRFTLLAAACKHWKENGAG